MWKQKLVRVDQSAADIVDAGAFARSSSIRRAALLMAPALLLSAVHLRGGCEEEDALEGGGRVRQR